MRTTYVLQEGTTTVSEISRQLAREQCTPSPAAELSGRRFLVTGGARGIGRAIVEDLAAGGAGGALIDLHDAAGLPWPVHVADVADASAMSRVVEAMIAADGPFDGLVAAAGIVPSWHTPADMELGVLDETMAVNVRGLVVALQCVVPTMTSGATIVAVGSLNSWKGDARLLAYAASKHAVLGVVRSAAMALGPQGIRVNAVAPGPIATEALLARIDARTERSGMDRAETLVAFAEQTSLRRLATQEDVAAAVRFLSSSGSASITGHLLPVDGGMA